MPGISISTNIVVSKMNSTRSVFIKNEFKICKAVSRFSYFCCFKHRSAEIKIYLILKRRLCVSSDLLNLYDHLQVPKNLQTLKTLAKGNSHLSTMTTYKSLAPLVRMNFGRWYIRGAHILIYT